MSLDEARDVLKKTAISFATGDVDDAEAVKSLCLAAIAYVDERAKLKPRAQNKEGATVVLPFGKDKGLPLTEAANHNLKWVAGILRESIDAPDKAKWRESNQTLLDAIERELATR